MRGVIVILVLLALATVVVAAIHVGSTKHGRTHAQHKIRGRNKRASHKKDRSSLSDEDTTSESVSYPAQLLQVVGTGDSTTLASHLTDGTFTTQTTPDGSSQLVWTSSMLVAGDADISESKLPLSIRLDARDGKDGTGVELVFDVTDWKANYPDAHEAWVDSYTALATTGISREGASLKIAVADLPRADGDEVCTITLEFATGPLVGNPSDLQCSQFATSMSNNDVFGAIQAVNQFLASATNDLPSTTIDAMNALFSSGSSLASESIRTNCFWIDSFMSSAPSIPPTPPTPPDS